MARTTHSARITGPVAYVAPSGKQLKIPLGPCLVEQGEGQVVDIVWGASGQNFTTLPSTEFERAEDSGHLVVLD
ncbi:MAG: hypothetical protein ABI781_21380 [Burkholderiales bacterium]